MTLTEAIAIAGIPLAILGALLRLVWASLMTKLGDIAREQSEMAAKLDAHIVSDTAAHERIKGAEVRLEETKEKLTEVDGRRHRYQVFNDEAVRDIRQLIADKMDGMHKWITETIVGALKP